MKCRKDHFCRCADCKPSIISSSHFVGERVRREQRRQNALEFGFVMLCLFLAVIGVLAS